MRAATLIGDIVSVTGTTVRVHLHEDQPSIAMVNGDTHRVGQVGAYLRIPVGYSDLYGICTQVGAGNAPRQVNDTTTGDIEDDAPHRNDLDGRWLTLSLFGEAVAGHFERGISRYPTIADEVHLVTAADVAMVHRSAPGAPMVTVGTIAASSGLPAELDIARLVARHSAVVGSTGAGKSNFIATFLRSIADGHLPTARVLVIDAHGEYGDSLADIARTFSIDPRPGQDALYIPYWALPFDELLDTTLGAMNDAHTTEVRTEIETRKREAAKLLTPMPPLEAISADSPVPFSIKELWMDLRQREDQTYKDAQRKDGEEPTGRGDVANLMPRKYPPHAPAGKAPFAPNPRGIGRQLSLMRNRILDTRYQFLFEPGAEYTPDPATSRTTNDLDELVADWIGHDKPVTVLDVSSSPADVLPLIVGTLLRITYDALIWAGDLDVSGRSQPLLVVLEEAHRFIRQGVDTAANRIISTIAKEGRKYGMGLMLVSQRPSDLDKDALSQCGTLVALRMTNQADRAHVTSVMPDDLALLANQLPALRTGEALISGEAVAAPTRARIRLEPKQHRGADADIAAGWTQADRPDVTQYKQAIANWRASSFLTPADNSSPVPAFPAPSPSTDSAQVSTQAPATDLPPPASQPTGEPNA